MRKRYAAFVAALLLSQAHLTWMSVAADDVTMEWKWEKDQVLKYRIIQNETVKMEAPPPPGDSANEPGDFRTSQKTEFLVSERVENVSPDGTATLRQTIEAVKLDMEQPFGRKFSYDSSKQVDKKQRQNPMIKPFTHFAGTSFFLVRDKTGRVLETRGMTEAVEGILEKTLEEAPDNPLSRGIKNHFSKMYGGKDYALFYQCRFEPLPAGGVSPGATWESQLDQVLPILGRTTLRVDHRFEKVERIRGAKCAAIASRFKTAREGALPHSPKDPRKPHLEMESMKAEGEGTLSFDLEAGRVVKQTLVFVMDVDSQMRFPTNTRGDMTREMPRRTPDRKMKQKITVRISLELLD